MLTIFRGDDLSFGEYNRKICIRLDTFLDLTGWYAQFQLVDNVKNFSDISSKLITFGYTAEETFAFPLGKTYAKLTIYDQSGQVRQIVKVEVEIINKRPEHAIDGFIAISIDNVIADYNILGNKPILNGKIIAGIHDADYYGLANKDELVDFESRVNERVDGIHNEVHTVANDVEELSEALATTNATVTNQGEAIGANYQKLLSLDTKVKELSDKVDGMDYDDIIASLSSQVSLLALRTSTNELNITNESTRAKTEETKIAGDVAVTQEMLDELQAGNLVLTQVLLSSVSDPNHNFRLSVVMRDAGGGNLIPTLVTEKVDK